LNNLILCGFKRSGKSSLGRELAEEAGFHFIDTDALIASDCRKFFLDLGAGVFRRYEKKIIYSIQHVERSVIATGGGTVLDPENIDILKHLGKIVYLQVDKDELSRRLLQPPLPAFFSPDNPKQSFEEMYHERAPIYEKIADIIVRTKSELWAVMHSEPCFASRPGENRTEKPSES
jgi:shikimate kinase